MLILHHSRRLLLFWVLLPSHMPLKICFGLQWLTPVAIPSIYLDIAGVAARRTSDLSQNGCVRELHKFQLIQKYVTPWVFFFESNCLG